MTRLVRARFERIEVTRDQNRIAEEQTAFLLGLAGGRTLKETLANAYLLGVIDAAEAMVVNSGDTP